MHPAGQEGPALTTTTTIPAAAASYAATEEAREAAVVERIADGGERWIEETPRTVVRRVERQLTLHGEAITLTLILGDDGRWFVSQYGICGYLNEANEFLTTAEAKRRAVQTIIGKCEAALEELRRMA